MFEVNERLLERCKSGIPFKQSVKTVRMNADPCNEFNLIRQFYEIVAGPRLEELSFDDSLLHCRKHDDWDIRGGRDAAESSHHIQAADAGHHEVLQDDGGSKSDCHIKGHIGLAAELKNHVWLAGEHAPHGLTNHPLVVDQQNPMFAGGHRK